MGFFKNYDIYSKARIAAMLVAAGTFFPALALCFVFAMHLPYLLYGIGWALIYGDGSVPLWYTIFSAAVFILVGVTPFIFSYLCAKKTYRTYLSKRKNA